MMRERIACLFLAISACLLASCVYSVHPLEQGKPSVVVSSLAGTWTATDEDGKLQSITIREPKPGEYEVTYADPDSGRSNRYEARLVRLGDFVFADAQLRGEVKGESVEDLPGGAVPLHMFFKILLTEDQFGLELMDHEWLNKQFAAGKLSTAHEELDDFTNTIILTAGSPQLQKILLQMGAELEAFGGGIVFIRKK